MIRVSAKKYNSLFNIKKPSKYNNKKIEVDGIKFDSRKEANRYTELKLLERVGSIKHLELQPKFLLQESFKHKGKTIRALYYVADFKYFDKKKFKMVVEDVKGMKTDVYKIKKKLFLFKYPEFHFIET